ncbi:MAG: DUF4386 domain-containing protein [Candidatus Methanoperedens sp.]|nr:DUF4386 domain-containing protein [Candidatus Methanoperedens sp.]
MIRKEMNSDRKAAIVVGVLFITATVAGILSEVFGPNLDAPDYLANLSANGNQVLIGALLVFTMAVLIAGIPIFMYPILKKYNEALALGYVVFRTIEVVFLIVSAISLLTLLTLSQEFVIAGTPDASNFQTLATLLLAVREWGGGVFSTIVFGLSALILNYVLYRSKLIPRWLSGWGLIGAILYLVSGFLPLFGHDPRSAIYLLMEAPLGLNEMVFAIWLIVKGFNPSAIVSGFAKEDII